MTRLHFQSHRSRGFSLIETFVAILIFSAAITVFLAIVSRGVFIGVSAKNTSIANFLAIEGAEVVRNHRDKNLLQGDPMTLGFSPECSGPFGCEITHPGIPSNYSIILSQCITSCGRLYLNATNRQYTTTPTSTITPFTRTIIVNETIPDVEYEVISTVDWVEKGVPYQVQIIHDLYAWYE